MHRKGHSQHREVEVLDHSALRVTLETAQRAPQRRHDTREAADARHHTADGTRNAVRRATAKSDLRQVLRHQHGRAPQHQQRAQAHLEQHDVQVRQQPDTEGHADQSAEHEGPEDALVERPPHRERRNHLPREGAEQREHGGQLRLQRPGPHRHRDHAESKARQALHEPRQHSADDHIDIQGLHAADDRGPPPAPKWLTPTQAPAPCAARAAH
ncbi:hypothetical protein D9M72_133680 [compost metagenome]